MNGVLYKYAINIWQTKYFQEIQKKIRREKRCFTSNPKIGYSYNKKKLEILERSHICLQNVTKQSRY